MTIEEIRKNAPDGATHYYSNVYGVKYYKFISTYLMLYHDGRWISSMMEIHRIKPL